MISLHDLKIKSGNKWNDRAASTLIELAVLAYKPRDIIRKKLEAEGIFNFQWFESIGATFDTQAFAFTSGNNIVIAFRGTKEIRDFLTDVMASKTSLRGYDHNETLSPDGVHYGFRHALDAIWSSETKTYQHAYTHPELTLVEYLAQFTDSGKQLWLTGHSLGGALATIAAAQIALSAKNTNKTYKTIDIDIAGLVTIGSPRVLAKKPSRELINTLGENKIYRIQKSIDPIPQVPFLGYSHVTGQRCYITSKDKLVIDVKEYRKILDRTYSVVRTVENLIGSAIPGQRKGLSMLISDHSSEDYLKAVRSWSESNRGGLLSVLFSIAISLFKSFGPFAAIVSTGIYSLSHIALPF